MRRLFMCTLVVFGFMNFSFGQLSVKSERVSVKIYEDNKVTKQLNLKGAEALAFDIPAYIKENEHLGRIVIKGSIRTHF